MFLSTCNTHTYPNVTLSVTPACVEWTKHSKSLGPGQSTLKEGLNPVDEHRILADARERKSHHQNIKTKNKHPQQQLTEMIPQQLLQ